jgi:transposase
MVLLSAQGMDITQIARVAFTSPDRVRDVINNFNDNGFESLYPRYAGGRPPMVTLGQRQAIKKIALSRPVDHDLQFSTWSLSTLAEFLVADGVGRRHQPRGPAGPSPQGGRPVSSDQDVETALNLMTDPIFGHVKTNKNRTTFLAFCRYLRSLYPPEVRIAIVMDNFSPHLSTKNDQRVGNWATENNVELAYVPTNASWLNRIECQFTALRYFTRRDGSSLPR